MRDADLRLIMSPESVGFWICGFGGSGLHGFGGWGGGGGILGLRLRIRVLHCSRSAFKGSGFRFGGVSVLA